MDCQKDVHVMELFYREQYLSKVRRFVINNFGAAKSIQSLRHSLEKVGLSVQRATLKRYTDVLFLGIKH